MLIQERTVKILRAGLDEVGRGALCGPMLVAVTAFDTADSPVEGIKDSKKLDAVTRERLALQIVRAAAFCNFGWVEPWEIDELGMTDAWQLACLRALQGAPEFQCLYVDGRESIVKYPGNQKTVIKGDATMWEIGAASIVAKVLRDNEMYHQLQFYPPYGWETNVGYGTDKHYELMKQNGITREHRKLFLRKFAKENRISLE